MNSEIKAIRSPVNVSILLAALFLLCFVSQAQAVPAFARQMGAPCSTCHYQHFPLLNSFGRSFKASGFTMSGTSNIESGSFSLPANMNAAMFSNVRYQKSSAKKDPNTHTSNDGEFIMPGETSLFIGGRVNKNVGALLEGDVGAAGLNGGGFLASLKIPFVFQASDSVSVLVDPFMSGLGPSYAYETLNTGAVGNHLINLVVPSAISAQQYVTPGVDSEGLGAAVVSNNFFVTVAKWSPNHSPIDDAGQSASPDSNYLRVAVTPMIGSWDTALGVQVYDGKSMVVGDQKYNTKAMAVDAQAQGTLGDMPFGVYLAYAEADASKAGKEPNLFNDGSKKRTAISLAAELGAFAGGRGTIQLAYRTAENGYTSYKTDNAATIGVTYLPSDNVQFGLYQTQFSGNANSKAGILANGQVIDATAADLAQGGGSSLTSLNLAVGF
jgi:hypothetical protein